MNAAPMISVVADDALYEVIDGRRVELPPRGSYETYLATILMVALNDWGRAERGRTSVEILFDLGHDRVRRPNVAYVSYQRWPRRQRIPSTAAWALVPDMAVEIPSVTTGYREITAKIAEYFSAGVQQCWVVDPGLEQVSVFTGPTRVNILTRADDLTAEPLLPGFRLPLSELFEADGE